MWRICSSCVSIATSPRRRRTNSSAIGRHRQTAARNLCRPRVVVWKGPRRESRSPQETRPELDFDVVGVQPVKVNGEVVSSTAIRHAVESGRFRQRDAECSDATTRFSEPWSRGRTSAAAWFPTANLSAHNEQFPPNGVYVAEALIQRSRFRGVANLGMRPTIAGGTRSGCSNCISLIWTGKFTARTLKCVLFAYLRPEKKFEEPWRLPPRSQKTLAERARCCAASCDLSDFASESVVETERRCSRIFAIAAKPSAVRPQPHCREENQRHTNEKQLRQASDRLRQR